MMEAIRNGMDPNEAYEKNIGTYGRFDEAVRKYIDPARRIRVGGWTYMATCLKATKDAWPKSRQCLAEVRLRILEDAARPLPGQGH